jgi:hypothetical protein
LIGTVGDGVDIKGRLPEIRHQQERRTAIECDVDHLALGSGEDAEFVERAFNVGGDQFGHRQASPRYLIFCNVPILWVTTSGWLANTEPRALNPLH